MVSRPRGKGLTRKRPRAGAGGKARGKAPRKKRKRATVATLAAEAAAILAGDHARRLPVGRTPTLARLTTAVNGIVDLLSSKERSLGDNIKSLQAVNRDLRAAQESLLRSEKLAAIGRVSAGIAHEIGNPIGAILGYLDLLKRRTGLDEEIRDDLSRVEAEAWRINAIIRELLDYARPAPGVLEALGVNDLVAETLDELTPQAAFRQIAFERDLGGELPPVSANRHRFRQLLVNLLSNARDAIEGQGRIRLVTRMVDSAAEPAPTPTAPPRRRSDPPEIDYSHLRPVRIYDPTADRPLASEARWIELRVADSGRGIPPEALREVFDPFFTTKAPGNGTGLGLPLALSIVRSFQGRMQISSEVGSGTTVSIQIPLAESPPLPPAA